MKYSLITIASKGRKFDLGDVDRVYYAIYLAGSTCMLCDILYKNMFHWDFAE